MPEETEQNQNPVVEEQNRAAELESMLAVKNEELTRANARITEMEQTSATATESIKGLEGTLTRAVASYRDMVVRSNPDVLKEMIAGDSIEAIDGSLAQARELVSRVRRGVEAEISSSRVPAGAPQRTAIGAQALSPREKIQKALGGHG